MKGGVERICMYYLYVLLTSRLLIMFRNLFYTLQRPQHAIFPSTFKAITWCRWARRCSRKYATPTWSALRKKPYRAGATASKKSETIRTWLKSEYRICIIFRARIILMGILISARRLFDDDCAVQQRRGGNKLKRYVRGVRSHFLKSESLFSPSLDRTEDGCSVRSHLRFRR